MRKQILLGLAAILVILIGLIVFIFWGQKKQPPIKTKAQTTVSMFTLVPPSGPINRNSDITFTININTQGQTVNKGELWLSFQSAYMTLVDVIPGDNGEFPDITYDVDGEIIKIEATSLEGFSGSGVFVKVIFHTKDIAPPAAGVELCSIITPTPTLITETPSPTSTPSATITRTPTPTPTSSPTATPSLSPTPIPTTSPTPSLTPTPTFTPSPTATPTPPPTYTPVPASPTLVVVSTPVPTKIPVAGIDQFAAPVFIISIALFLTGIVLRVIL